MPRCGCATSCPAAPDVELHFQINEGERDTIGPWS
jgi:hypothetical protein